jgi:hypothetical protein
MNEDEKKQLRRIAAEDQVTAWIRNKLDTDYVLEQMVEDPAGLKEQVGEEFFVVMASALAWAFRRVLRDGCPRCGPPERD